MKKEILAAIFLSVSSLLVAENTLSPELTAKLQSNVFEVVVKKTEKDPLSYERELPLDRLPFQERTDKYNSIGTAFLMDNGLFYTAAHVLQLAEKSQQEEYFIRRTNEDPLPIDSIVKFSSNRDFVIFTVKGFQHTAGEGLRFQNKIDLNSTVFAVGNAQGEGVVIRNGLLTSQTFEDRDGAWKWLRFSAAASPGNSGGPLVNTDGDVIGIITMKNKTENLNYALPVSEISNIPENTGVFHDQFYYFLPNVLSQRFYHPYDFTITLPQPISVVRKISYEALRDDTKKFAESLDAQFIFGGDKSVTETDPGNALLNSDFNPSFPYTIILAENGKWGFYYPNNLKTFQLPENGSIEYGTLAGFSMAYIHKPDNVTEADLVQSAKMRMDYIIKANAMYRSVGNERVNITSYGESAVSATHKDTLGRTWLVNTWKIPFADIEILSYTLPLPDGIFVIYSTESTATIENGINYDLPYMTDFVIPRYNATVKEWKEYLALPPSDYPRHEVLADTEIDTGKESTKISIGRFKGDIPLSDVSVDDSATLSISTGFDMRDGKQESDVRSFILTANQNTNDYCLFLVSHVIKPVPTADKNLRDTWEQLISRSIPYNAQSFTNDQFTYFFKVIKTDDNSCDFYGLSLKGTDQNEKMKTLAADIEKTFSF